MSAAIDFAYRQFTRRRFPLPSPEQLETLERRLKIRFAEDDREFILNYNGGYFADPAIARINEDYPDDALTYLSGIGASHEQAELGTYSSITIFDDNDPLLILPIGGTIMAGLIILITEEEGRGEIWLKQAFGEFFYPAEGIAEFFELLYDYPERTA